MRRFAWVLLMSLFAVACAGSAEPATTTPSTTSKTPTTTTTTTTSQAPTTTTTTRASTTFTTSVDLDALRAELFDLVTSALESGRLGEFERVDLVSFDAGSLEIEGHLRWASEDRQSDSHWASVVLLAQLFCLTDMEVGQAANLFDGRDPRVHMVTVSVDGDYRYESVTDWDTLTAIGARNVGFDGWVEATGAGFK